MVPATESLERPALVITKSTQVRVWRLSLSVLSNPNPNLSAELLLRSFKRITSPDQRCGSHEDSDVDAIIPLNLYFILCTFCSHYMSLKRVRDNRYWEITRAVQQLDHDGRSAAYGADHLLVFVDAEGEYTINEKSTSNITELAFIVALMSRYDSEHNKQQAVITVRHAESFVIRVPDQWVKEEALDKGYCYQKNQIHGLNTHTQRTAGVKLSAVREQLTNIVVNLIPECKPMQGRTLDQWAKQTIIVIYKTGDRPDWKGLDTHWLYRFFALFGVHPFNIDEPRVLIEQLCPWADGDRFIALGFGSRATRTVSHAYVEAHSRSRCTHAQHQDSERHHCALDDATEMILSVALKASARFEDKTGIFCDVAMPPPKVHRDVGRTLALEPSTPYWLQTMTYPAGRRRRKLKVRTETTK